MNDHDDQADARVRIARHGAACAAPGCRTLIWPGSRIVKIPGPHGWRHLDCAKPGRERGRRQAP